MMMRRRFGMRVYFLVVAGLIAVTALLAAFLWREPVAPPSAAGLKEPSAFIAKPSPFTAPKIEVRAHVTIPHLDAMQPPVSKGFKHRLALLWPFRKWGRPSGRRPGPSSASKVE